MEIDRISLQQRPTGRPAMYQTWAKLLFMHWRLPAKQLRSHVPAGLDIDTFDGSAWIGLTPFTLWGLRPALIPPLPIASSSHELNVRTYVHRRDVPGIWFFSLDASNRLAVLGARAAFSLPYFSARISMSDTRETIEFTSRRTAPEQPPVEFAASWQCGAPLTDLRPGTLDFFLIERYCLYAEHDAQLYRSRIHHHPWPLRQARLLQYSSTMLQAQGLPVPHGEPLVHAQAQPIKVAVWPLERV